MIRVLVVDDSAFMRKMITDFLAAEVQIEVIGTARNGEEALKKIELLKPDVVTLDIEMLSHERNGYIAEDHQHI